MCFESFQARDAKRRKLESTNKPTTTHSEHQQESSVCGDLPDASPHDADSAQHDGLPAHSQQDTSEHSMSQLIDPALIGPGSADASAEAVSPVETIAKDPNTCRECGE